MREADAAAGGVWLAVRLREGDRRPYIEIAWGVEERGQRWPGKVVRISIKAARLLAGVLPDVLGDA